MATDLDSAKYASFVTYKKDGTPVATPVWIVPYDGGYAFTTDPDAYKVKRLKNDARATLTICDMRGNVKQAATTHLGSAVLLDELQTRDVERLISQKYPLGVKMLSVMTIVKKVLGKGTSAGDAAIKVTLHS